MIRVEDAFHLCFGFKLMCMHNTSNPSPLDKRPPINASKKKVGSWEIFQPVTFEVKRPTKNFLYFFYLALALFLVELPWPVALLSLFLCLSLSLFSKFMDMTINLNLIL